jgi:D-3-phosphoglycerate dehydrogenase
MVLTAFVTSDLTPIQLDRLSQRCKVQRGGWGLTGTRLTPAELIQAAAEAEILLVGYEAVNKQVIRALPQLQLIGCSRSSPVNVDLAVATKRGIPVLHTPGRNTQTAAEFTLGLMLAEAHRITHAYYALKRGKYLGKPSTDFSTADRSGDVTWNLDGESSFKDFQGVELAGRCLGIIGLGKIGKRVAQLAQAFDMRVIAYSPYTNLAEAEEIQVQLVDLDSLLQQADFISVHASVTDETWGMLGERELNLMKPTAYLISISRAAVIDQGALIKVLQERRIAGAALDVFWYEPLPANHPLLNLENVSISPHLAGATHEVIERHSQMIVNDVLTWLDGDRPTYIANPEVLKTDETHYK